MENLGATWEQIVALASSLDRRGGGSHLRVEDQIRLARLVIDFNLNVVGQRLKRSPAAPAPRAVGTDPGPSPIGKRMRAGPGVVACTALARETPLDLEA